MIYHKLKCVLPKHINHPILVVAFGFIENGVGMQSPFLIFYPSPGLSATAMKAWGRVGKEIKLLNSNLTFPKTPSAAI